MDLDRLRQDLGDVDRQLVTLIARRQQLASEIGRLKQKSGRTTRDYGQERDVIERARQAAQEVGLAPGLAESVLLQLIEASLTVQEQDKVVDQGTGSGQRVLVIGGAGKMGRWFVRFLHSQGFLVEVADPSGEVPGHRYYDDWHAATLDHEFIVVAAPLRESNRILTELASDPPSGVVFDIGSLKSPLRRGLRALMESGARVTSIHPMFGPDTELLSERHVIVVDLGVAEANDAARDLFASTMALHVEMDLESHDRLVAYVLGLSHAVNIAFASALAVSGEAVPSLEKISSTTFEAQLGVTSRVVEESPHLYFEIQSLNEFGPAALSALRDAVTRLQGAVAADEEAEFVQLMEEGRKYLASRRSGHDA